LRRKAASTLPQQRDLPSRGRRADPGRAAAAGRRDTDGESGAAARAV